MRGELLTAPRLKNPKVTRAINDIVLKALAPADTDFDADEIVLDPQFFLENPRHDLGEEPAEVVSLLELGQARETDHANLAGHLSGRR